MCWYPINEKMMKKSFFLLFLLWALFLNINIIDAKSNANNSAYFFNTGFQEISLIIMFIIIAITIIIYILFGQEKRLNIIIKPFQNFKFSSAEIGFLVNDKLRNKDLASLIGYWSCKGFIKIVYFENDNYYQFIKLKEISSNIEYEKHLFEELFSKSDTILSNELPNSFFNIKMKSQKKYRQDFEDEIGIYNKVSTILKYLFLVIITFIFSLILFIASYNFNNDLKQSLIFFVVSFLLLIVLAFLLSYVIKNYRILNNYLKIIIVILVSLGYLALAIFIVFFANYINFSIKVMLINLTLYLLSIFIISAILKRSDKNHHLYEEVLGFRNYLTSSSNRIIADNIHNNLTYYEIMVYAFVLNIEDIYLEKVKHNHIYLLDNFEVINGESDNDNNYLEIFLKVMKSLDINYSNQKYNKYEKFNIEKTSN